VTIACGGTTHADSSRTGRDIDDRRKSTVCESRNTCAECADAAPECGWSLVRRRCDDTTAATTADSSGSGRTKWQRRLANGTAEEYDGRQPLTVYNVGSCPKSSVGYARKPTDRDAATVNASDDPTGEFRAPVLARDPVARRLNDTGRPFAAKNAMAAARSPEVRIVSFEPVHGPRAGGTVVRINVTGDPGALSGDESPPTTRVPYRRRRRRKRRRQHRRYATSVAAVGKRPSGPTSIPSWPRRCVLRARSFTKIYSHARSVECCRSGGRFNCCKQQYPHISSEARTRHDISPRSHSAHRVSCDNTYSAKLLISLLLLLNVRRITQHAETTGIHNPFIT